MFSSFPSEVGLQSNELAEKKDQKGFSGGNLIQKKIISVCKYNYLYVLFK